MVPLFSCILLLGKGPAVMTTGLAPECGDQPLFRKIRLSIREDPRWSSKPSTAHTLDPRSDVSRTVFGSGALGLTRTLLAGIPTYT
jgi:hypothetical protein